VDLTAQETTTEETTTEETTTEKETTTVEETTKQSEVTIGEDGLATSEKVRIKGYQISTYFEGSRIVASVDKTIDGKRVVDFGLVFGLKQYSNTDTRIENSDLYVRNDHAYVKSYQSTDMDMNSTANESNAQTKNFIMTMKYGRKNKKAMEALYKVRSYVVLEDGTYVYSKVGNYSVFKIAKVLYEGCLMNSLTTHNYLYNTILKTVQDDYKEVNYTWDNTILRP
jgi:hypothetical protein